MILLIDSGNTRVKWRLVNGGKTELEGAGVFDVSDPFERLRGLSVDISRVDVSTVGSEDDQLLLASNVREFTLAPITFHWAEACRDGLTSSYQDVARMGADRWHGMLAAWQITRAGCAVVDAGSAVTVDYVSDEGKHLGGYILPGLQMMRRSLKLEAARIGFDFESVLRTVPGVSTGECANHGLAWLTEGVVRQVHRDVAEYGLQRIIVTGGDAERFINLGLQADRHEGLVLDGLYSVVCSGSVS